MRALTADLLNCDPGPAFVLDAEAPGQLKDVTSVLARHQGQLVITPQAGEMANLLGIDKHEVLRNLAVVAAETATLVHCVVGMKGSRPYIPAPDAGMWTYGDVRVGRYARRYCCGFVGESRHAITGGAVERLSPRRGWQPLGPGPWASWIPSS